MNSDYFRKVIESDSGDKVKEHETQKAILEILEILERLDSKSIKN